MLYFVLLARPTRVNL